MSKRTTAKQWIATAHTNEVAVEMKRARFLLQDMVDGSRYWNAVYLSGSPGIGKSHVTTAAVEAWLARGLSPISCRPRSGPDLINYFMLAKGRHPLILEEADIIFRSKSAFEILKKATDPAGERVHVELVRKGRTRAPVRVNLNVPLVVSTNLDLKEDRTWAAELLGDRDALFERSQPVVFSRDPHDLWEWTIFVALTTNLLKEGHYRSKEIPLKVVVEAMNWFTSNAQDLDSISPRTLKQIAQWMHRRALGDICDTILDRQLAGMLSAKSSGTARFYNADWETIRRDVLAQKGMREKQPSNVKSPQLALV